MKTINIEPNLRPCLVTKTTLFGKPVIKKALFHKWFVDWKSDIPYDDGLRALVEYEDGTMGKVTPKLIKFLDPRHNDFDWRR